MNNYKFLLQIMHNYSIFYIKIIVTNYTLFVINSTDWILFIKILVKIQKINTKLNKFTMFSILVIYPNNIVYKYAKINF